MANLNRVWKRWMATGCLHSTHACREYMRNVREFKKQFAPHDYTELGDVLETTCLRSGARGTKDEAEPLEPDLRIGLDWVREMQPTRWMWGNHDDRVNALLAHPSAMVSELARRLHADMMAAARDAGAKVYGYDIETGWAKVGDIYMGHGYMFNMQALRDHVEMTGGKTCIAHLHTPEIYGGRVLGSPWGVCVGTGADPRRMGYARRRKNTLRWGHGIAYGEFCDTDSTMQLLNWRCAHGAKESPRWLIS
jgi:hypothetical protein